MPWQRLSQHEAEDSEAVGDESDTSSDEASPCSLQAVSTKSFEKIAPVEDTPWAEFATCVGKLLAWPVAFVLFQICWSMRMRHHIDVAFFPVSLALVPFAFCWLRGKRQVAIQDVKGLEFMLYWLCSQSPFLRGICLGAWGQKQPANAARTLGDQVRGLSKAGSQRGGLRYHVGLASCTLLFWILLVGQSCWPAGYLYLVNYSFVRCEHLCGEVNRSISEANTDNGLRLIVEGNLTEGRQDLVRRCSDGLGFRRNEPYPSEQWRRWSDPHWLIEPHGAWVIGEPLEGVRVHFNTSRIYDSADVDCHQFSKNQVVLFTSLLLAIIFLALMCSTRGQHPLLTAGAVLLALLCATGILTVWRGWAHCRNSLYGSEVVFVHSLYSCLSVVEHNGTSLGATLHKNGHWLAAYEAKFRDVHQISRSEVWFGSVGEAFLLAIVVAAHVVFKHKRMQTSETRFHLLCRRPRLVAYMLGNLNLLDSLPSRDRTVTAWTVYRVFEDRPGEFRDLEEKMGQMMTLEQSDNDLSGTASSFWPAAIYSAVRALIPSIYRQLLPTRGQGNALPEENRLWLANALLVVVTHFGIYLFVLFQVNEAVRRYVETMQVWLLFDSLWHFPSRSLLVGDAITEIVQVRRRRDGGVVEMLGPRRAFMGDFSCENAFSESQQEGMLVNLQKVKEDLPTWWAWREYLLIDYTDKRVRLELHLLVGFAVLLTTAGQVIADAYKDGFYGLDLLDLNSDSWLGRHFSPLFLQSTCDVVFLIFPLLRAIHCAATMNSLIEAQLKKVLHLEDLCDGARRANSQLDCVQDNDDDPGVGIRNIFRMAKGELSKGGSAAKLFNCCTISKRTFAVTGATMSVFGGSQVVEMLNGLGSLVNE